MVEIRTVRKLFTLEERREIYKWIKKGYALKSIARLIGRSGNGVVEEVRKNGGRENYDPEKAHEMVNVRYLNRIEGLRHSTSPSYEARISALEMQVSILHELITNKKR